MNVGQILEGMKSLKVLVVGDICLDRWCWYDPALALASAETGIPRTAVVRTEVTPGAGGTVANNLAALGVGSIAVLGVVGEDGFGWELKNALRSRSIQPDLLVTAPGVPTFTYTKLLNTTNGEEDLPRVDFINPADMPASVEAAVVERFDGHAADFDVVIVADQAETERGGVVTPGVRERIGRAKNRVVWVDSRRRPELFRNVVVKPNQSEAEEACVRAFGEIDYRRLYEHCELKTLIVTHGGRGALVIDRDGETMVPGRQVTPVDICGAGDSFSAGAACALAITGSATDAARFGNLVASITVTKKGTGVATPEELLAI